MQENNNIRIAFYARVSTDEQAKDGFWIDYQLSDMTGMMQYRSQHHNWIHDMAWEYIDNPASWADLNRRAYKQMMQDAKDGKFDIIAVWKIDRLSRNLSHLLSTFEILQSYKVWFFSLKENIDFSGPIGKLTFQIFWALAEFERETIKMRTREGKNASARRGNYVINSAPFGYEKIKTTGSITKGLRILEEEAEWVRRIFAECNAWTSLNGIAEILNQNKVYKGMWSIRKAKNTKWYGTKIRDILEDTTYTGNALYEPKNDKGEVESISIPVPQIIHPLTFEIAQNCLKKISENTQRGWWERNYLLSWKVIDITTGRGFVWYTRWKWGHGYRRKGFTDIKGNWIKNTEIPGQALDEYVWAHIENIIQRPKDLFEAYKKQSIDWSDYDDILEDRRKADANLQESHNTERTIEHYFLSGKYSEEKRDQLISDEVEKRNAIEKRISELDKKLDSIVEAQSTKEALEVFSQNMDIKINNLSQSQKESLVDILVDRIEVIIKKTWSKEDIQVKINLRFDPKNAFRNSEWSNQKIPPLTDNLSKEGSNFESWWRCRGSNPGPWP
jgi:site-specific DNA recombinase